MSEIRWTDPLAEALFLDLKRKIDETMALPEWALQRPDVHRRAIREAMEASEVMQREAAKLLSLYTIPPETIVPADAGPDTPITLPQSAQHPSR